MRVAAVGDNVVDCYRGHDIMYPGGNAANVAVYAKRAGAQHVGYIGSIGADVAGRHVADSLLAEGVDTTRLRVRNGPTAYAMVTLRDNERIFEGSSRGVVDFRLTDGDLEYVRTLDLVHTGDCSGMEDVLPALASATRVSFDFGDRYDSAYASALLPSVWFAAFSASDLSPTETEALLAWAAARGPSFVLATRGAQGAYLYDGACVRTAEAVDCAVVDTLGAGDAFIATMLVRILSGGGLSEALAEASNAAAGACRRLGAFGEGIPVNVAGPAVRKRTPLRDKEFVATHRRESMK